METGHEVEEVPRAETGFSAAQREWIDRLIADKIATVTSKGTVKTVGYKPPIIVLYLLLY